MVDGEERETFQAKVLRELEQQEIASRRAMQTELAILLRYMSDEPWQSASQGTEKAAEGAAKGTVKCAAGKGEKRGEESYLTLTSPRPEVWKKCFTLLQKTYNIDTKYAQEGLRLPDVIESPSDGEGSVRFCGEAARRISSLRNPPARFEQDDKCVRGYLAGTFLCVGTVRDPKREYYLSFETRNDRQAQEVIRLLSHVGIPMKQQGHGRGHGVLTRDSAVIADVLNVLGAHVSMMDLENARIVRQVRGRINRKVNCETANIMKTVAASQKQMEEIQLLRASSIWDTLPESLQEMALLRERYPDSSLQELGERMNPPVGKSGVNHRLRRLSVLAKGLQEQEARAQR